MLITELDKLSRLNLNNWQEQMVYPFTDKFVLWDEIRDSLTGYGRMIYYQTFTKDRSGQPDPTVISSQKNWIMFIKEGEFKKGLADGYQRQMIAQNGHCRQGYYLENEPYGKFVEYDIDGTEFKKMGIYQDEDLCVKQLVFDDFAQNITPD